jgi:hypothetical protein
MTQSVSYNGMSVKQCVGLRVSLNIKYIKYVISYHDYGYLYDKMNLDKQFKKE